MSFTCKEPKLRFPEFHAEWEEKKIGNILKIGSGKDYKHLENGDIPVYGTGGYMLSVNEYLYDGESVCIGRKGTIDKPVLLSGKFWTVDTLFYTHSFNESIPKFVYAIFQRINWKEHNEASGVPSLSKNTIESIKINIPSKPEQEKIASFLTAVDAKIEQLTCKEKLLEKYKKSVMQKLFSQELRFTCNDGSEYPEWKEKKLGEICLSISSGKSKVEENGKYLVYGSTGAIGNTNHFTHEGSYILVARVGANAGLTNLVSGKFGVTDNTLIIDIKNETNELKFILSVLNKYNLNRLVFGSGQPLITGGQLKSLHVKLPSLPEQTKIANFLSAIDEKCLHVKTQIEQTKQFKKALLQQMFV